LDASLLDHPTMEMTSTPVAMIEWHTQNLEALEKSLALHLHGEVYDFVA